jgi:DNA-binding MarR family transcriptional regulator
VNEVKGRDGMRTTVVFQLGVLGAIAADRFAARIEVHNLKPKHVGLMVALDAGLSASEQELAGRLGVAPSLVVSLADHLEALGAVTRARDPHDRRRQTLTLTTHGKKLLNTCETLARELDEELTAKLGAQERQRLERALGALLATAYPT